MYRQTNVFAMPCAACAIRVGATQKKDKIQKQTHMHAPNMEKQKKLLGLLILKMKMEKQVVHLPTEKVITNTLVQNQNVIT